MAVGLGGGRSGRPGPGLDGRVVVELGTGLVQSDGLGRPLVAEPADPGQGDVEAVEQLLVGVDGLVEELAPALR